MRHRKARNTLGMRTSHREAMLRNMVTSLLECESITTTDARAKAIRSIADKMITLGKRGDLHARRLAMRVLRSKRVMRRLFEDIAPRYTNRQGGYVRVIRKGFRAGDGAEMSIVELVEKKTEKAEGPIIVEKAKSLKDRIIERFTS